MPPGVNHAAVASAGAIAVSVAVAAAIALYESPEVRRYTDDLRRRIAMTLQNMSDGIQPPERPPMFNRPEDAQGFLETRRGNGAEPGVDADEESRRRQREELMYWNAVHLEKKAREQKEAQQQSEKEGGSAAASRPRGSTFDDFLKHDANGEKGSFVYNTGADVHGQDQGLVQRRPHDGVRGLNSAAVFANPFADEFHMDSNDLAPGKDESVSDIYSASSYNPDEKSRERSVTLDAAGPAIGATAGAAAGAVAVSTAVVEDAPTPPLVDCSDVESGFVSARDTDTETMLTERSVTLDRELGQDEYMTAGQEDRVNSDAYASIQAWAQGSSGDFYSPLPMSPAAPVSEPEMVSEGMLTPTDSVSVIGSAEHLQPEGQASASGPANGQTSNEVPFDVLSESDGMMTPASWSEVGSVVSETESREGPARVPAS